MQIQYLHWNAAHGWRGADARREPPQLVLYFGSREQLVDGWRYRELRGLYPDSHVVGCSSGGQIHGDDICDDEAVAVAVRFANTQMRLVQEVVENRVAAVAFYGASFRFAHGCAGGWDVFGPRRKVTKARGSVVVEARVEAQRAFLAREACEEMQGYLVGRPERDGTLSRPGRGDG